MLPKQCILLLLRYAKPFQTCVFITAGPSTKLFAWGGGGIWEDMCYERRRAEACVDYCVKEGGGGEGKCERECALERLRYYSPGH
jgi:hypothetical protein